MSIQDLSPGELSDREQEIVRSIRTPDVLQPLYLFCEDKVLGSTQILSWQSDLTKRSLTVAHLMGHLDRVLSYLCELDGAPKLTHQDLTFTLDAGAAPTRDVRVYGVHITYPVTGKIALSEKWEAGRFRWRYHVTLDRPNLKVEIRDITDGVEKHWEVCADKEFKQVRIHDIENKRHLDI